MALATAAGAEAEGQVIAFLGPHVLAALLLVPAAGPADAVELHQDAALPLVEALQVHPGAAWAVLAVAHHLLIIILLQVHRPPKAADQGRGTRSLWRRNRNGDLMYTFKGKAVDPRARSCLGNISTTGINIRADQKTCTIFF